MARLRVDANKLTYGLVEADNENANLMRQAQSRD